ncbi:MAG: serine/threonine-protein kinase, partial [Candidatus Margulisbacteria bacterium]|nr:serine/threonine-protein kinase [Candidatus Margulisiibacteriota bacterium]
PGQDAGLQPAFSGTPVQRPRIEQIDPANLIHSEMVGQQVGSGSRRLSQYSGQAAPAPKKGFWKTLRGALPYIGLYGGSAAIGAVLSFISPAWAVGTWFVSAQSLVNGIGFKALLGVMIGGNAAAFALLTGLVHAGYRLVKWLRSRPAAQEIDRQLLIRTFTNDNKGLLQAYADLEELNNLVAENNLSSKQRIQIENRLPILTAKVREISIALNLVIDAREMPDHPNREYFLLPADDAVAARLQKLAAKNPPEIPMIDGAHFLGGGGMGEVYQAFDVERGEFVALKMLKELAYADLFVNEYKNMRALDGVAGVCQAYGLSKVTLGSQNYPFIAMQLLPVDNNLDSLIKQQRFNADEAVNVVMKVMDILHQLHEKGIIHRDLKPGNIFYDRDTGEVVITDLGLALDSTEDMGKTSTGTFKGSTAYSAPYMANEYYNQDRADRLNNRQKYIPLLKSNDRYALGVILYKMLTGHSLIWQPQAGGTPAMINYSPPIGAWFTGISYEKLVLDYEAFKAAKVRGDTVEANRIRSQYTLVKDLSKVDPRLAISIPDDIYHIICQLITWDRTEEYYKNTLAARQDLERVIHSAPLPPEPAAGTISVPAPPTQPGKVQHGQPLPPPPGSGTPPQGGIFSSDKAEIETACSELILGLTQVAADQKDAYVQRLMEVARAHKDLREQVLDALDIIDQ